ncbi:hypothetical protein [Streptomyces sp. NPDC054783]
MGRESVSHPEMTPGADVPYGPRRRERLFDINNPAGWVGFNDPNATASTDDMTDDQNRSLPPEISMSTRASATPEPPTCMFEDGEDSMKLAVRYEVTVLIVAINEWL